MLYLRAVRCLNVDWVAYSFHCFHKPRWFPFLQHKGKWKARERRCFSSQFYNRNILLLTRPYYYEIKTAEYLTNWPSSEPGETFICDSAKDVSGAFALFSQTSPRIAFMQNDAAMTEDCAGCQLQITSQPMNDILIAVQYYLYNTGPQLDYLIAN